jgi:glutamate dehydrogenase
VSFTSTGQLKDYQIRGEHATLWSITISAPGDAFGLRELWAEIESLDNKVPSDAQTAMLLDIGQLVERCTRWFLRHGGGPLNIAASIDNFTPGIDKLSRHLKDVLSTGHHDRVTKKTQRYTAKGVPKALAQRIASLDPLAAALDIVNAAQRNDLAVEAAGKIYFQVGERLGLAWLRTSARGFSANTHWQRQAVTAIIDDLYVQQRALTSSVIEANGDDAVDGAVNGWIDANRAAVGRNEQLLADMRKSGAVDIAMLAVANRQIRVLAAG